MGDSIGWGGQFHLHNGTALQQLVDATAFDLPQDEVDEHETTRLNAANRRKTFVAGMIDGGTFTVDLVYVPNSADDQLLLAAKAAGDTRAWKSVIPDDDGTPLRQFTGTGWVKKYAPNKVETGAPMTATLEIRVSGAVTEAAYS